MSNQNNPPTTGGNASATTASAQAATATSSGSNASPGGSPQTPPSSNVPGSHGPNSLPPSSADEIRNRVPSTKTFEVRKHPVSGEKLEKPTIIKATDSCEAQSKYIEKQKDWKDGTRLMVKQVN